MNPRNDISEGYAIGLGRRFWDRVLVPDGCWEWQGSLDVGGYGVFGKLPYKVHRVVWTLFYGEIPTDTFVLHRCDNRRCLRPDHLFLGSKADNAHDRDAKGRRVVLVGEAAPGARFTESTIRAIYAAAAAESRTAVARRFGTTVSLVSDIALGRRWRHLGLKPLPKIKVGRPSLWRADGKDRP